MVQAGGVPFHHDAAIQGAAYRHAEDCRSTLDSRWLRQGDRDLVPVRPAPVGADRNRGGGQWRDSVDDAAARVRSGQAHRGVKREALSAEFGRRLKPGEEAVRREATERTIRRGTQDGALVVGIARRAKDLSRNRDSP